MKLLACLGCLFVAILFGHLLQKFIERVPQPPTTDAPLPPLTELQGLKWMPCDAPTCAHLETTHRRVHATELWACTGCGNTRTAPAGARRG